MNDALHEEKVGPLTIKIMTDYSPPDPRKDNENFGTMVCLHRRYDLGDESKLSLDEANELEARVEKEGGVVLPLYLYNHSGITISTKPFSCPWDSGRLGFIYVEAADIKKEFGVIRPQNLNAPGFKGEAERILEGEVETYDKYLTGSYVGWVVEDEDGEHVESCWGYDDQDYALKEAQSTAKSILKHRKLDAKAAKKKAEESITPS